MMETGRLYESSVGQEAVVFLADSFPLAATSSVVRGVWSTESIKVECRVGMRLCRRGGGGGRREVEEGVDEEEEEDEDPDGEETVTETGAGEDVDAGAEAATDPEAGEAGEAGDEDDGLVDEVKTTAGGGKANGLVRRAFSRPAPAPWSA